MQDVFRIEVDTNRLGLSQLHLRLPGKPDPVMSSEIFDGPDSAMVAACQLEDFLSGEYVQVVKTREGSAA